MVERLLYSDNGNRYRSAAEVPFYKLQQKVILKNVGLIDPLDIDDALKAGAYRSLVKALTQMTTDQIIETVTVAGLRGRGGGGFPTGYKWRKAVENARDNPGPVFIVANGDEGDPGAFMDRAIMEGDPHAVLEGMAIGARAMGAEQGYLYVRAEYPFAIRTLNIAIEQARALGLLGQDILGTGFNFDVRINRGRRGLCLRRRDGPPGLHRGPGRRTRHPAALPGGRRFVGPPHGDQQRRDLGQRPPYH